MGNPTPTPTPAAPGASQARFGTTRWTVVLNAGESSSAERRAALEDLLARYWPPVYAYIRRTGEERTSAEDLTQGFFLDLLERDFLVGVGPEKGRFRAYLLACLRHYLGKEWEGRRAAKRGGGKVIALDPASIEASLAATQETPEAAYERQWAWDVLTRALKRLEDDWTRAGRRPQWELYRAYLDGARGGAAPVYADLAHSAGISEAAVTNALHRARARLKELITEEVRETCTGPDEVEAEVQSLFRALNP